MNENLLVKFGQIIRELRLESKLSQEELSYEANLHRTYIGMIERGEKNITLQNIYKLSMALNIPTVVIFDKLDKSIQ